MRNVEVMKAALVDRDEASSPNGVEGEAADAATMHSLCMRLDGIEETLENESKRIAETTKQCMAEIRVAHEGAFATSAS